MNSHLMSQNRVIRFTVHRLSIVDIRMSTYRVTDLSLEISDQTQIGPAHQHKLAPQRLGVGWKLEEGPAWVSHRRCV